MSSKKSLYNNGDKLILNSEFRNSDLGRLFSLYSNLALNRFKWEGLPPSVESRHIERSLFYYGQCFMYENKDLGLIALPCINSGQLNIYGEVTNVNLIGHGQTFTNIDIKDGVHIKANNLDFPIYLNILHYAEMINLINTSIKANVEKLKTPYIVSTTKENEKSYRILLNKIKNGEDEMFIDNSLSNGGRLGIEILNTHVPMYIPNLQQLKHDLECELLTILGINNTSANNDKKERLLVDEVNVNNGEILSYLDIDYQLREQACEKMNKLFNLNVSVEKNILKLSREVEGKGGLENNE